MTGIGESITSYCELFAVRTKNNSSAASVSSDAASRCAAELLEIIPGIMGALRCEMHRQSEVRMTLVQFRVLAFLGWNDSASLSCLASFLGIGLPSTSKVVEGLVKAGLLERRADPADRRRLLLELSATGRMEAEATRNIAQACLAKRLSSLDSTETERLRDALTPLRPLFLTKPLCKSIAHRAPSE